MNFKKRIALLLLVLLTACLYFPLNRWMSGGVNLQIFLDAYVPLVPIFTVPYLLSLPFWGISFLYAAWKMDDALFRSFIMGSIAVIIISTLIYLIFPTYTDRPVITGTGWSDQLLAWVYSNDDLYNAFPSGHVLFTTIIALFGARWKPSWRWALQAGVMLVVLSTLFTGQHHLLDPLGGMSLGYAGYQMGLWFERIAPQFGHKTAFPASLTVKQ